MADGVGGGGDDGATGSTREGGGGKEVIGSKRGGTGRGRGEGRSIGAMDGGGEGARWSLGASGSLMRLMTFSESCKGQWKKSYKMEE